MGGGACGDLIEVYTGCIAGYIETCGGAALQYLLIHEAACNIKEPDGDVILQGVLEVEHHGGGDGVYREVL